MNAICLGGIIYVHIEKIRDRTKLCGTPACIFLCVDISHSTEKLNFRCEREEPISSMNWTMLLPSDTHRENIISITAVSPLFVTYYLPTLPRMNIFSGVPKGMRYSQKVVLL
jgi:hypothetical protein